MIHNFTHSFVGGCNYVDGAHVYEDLYSLAIKKNGEPLTIDWLTPNMSQLALLTPRIRKSVDYYLEWLPEHAEKSGVLLGRLIEFKTEIYINRSRQIRVKATAIDNNGKEHSCFVWA